MPPEAPSGSSQPLTLGTAGHIDHGKTALIRALTGTDTDRLPQEQARGISIELGYAHLVLPSGRRLSVIDVPGHERFVRTMVAGATGIDLFLMTIAADDGVMPQTREHALVLEALGLRTGVVAITKCDLADPEPAMLEASDLLPHAEAVAVSARSGQGLQKLQEAIDDAAGGLRSRAEADSPARLHIDRAFTVRGAGTVVTGTLWSGQVERGDELRLLPAARRVRVRGVQVHDQPVQRAGAGQRVAVNLVGVAVVDVERGDVLVSDGAEIRPTYLIDAQLSLAGREPGHGHRVQVHHGTRESPGRVAWLGGSFWQLRLEQPLVPMAGDRLVIRQIAPPDTLGGGVVLDPHPRKHGASRALLVRLERISRGESVEADAEVTRSDQASQPATPPEPLSPGALAAEQRLREAGIEPPPDSEFDPADLAALRAVRRAVRVSRSLHYHPAVLQEISARVVELAAQNGGSVTLAQLRDDLNTSRKFAQALLEHFDSAKLTLRRGDEHVLRRSPPAR
ncbi:MAG: selenocysteine-specific translation elongation factor [Solirubrobacteraceae bacterium]